MSAESTIRTAVVGCGYWGKNLVRNFSTLSNLKMCCDLSPQVRAKIAAQYPQVDVTDHFDAVLGDPEIDAVILAVPSSQHASMAEAALRADKHVFVEKPLALSVVEAQRVVETADSVDRVLMVGHLLEYHPAVEHLRELITSGTLGDTYYMYTQRLNLGKVRSDENSLWSLAPHDISVVLYLFDEEPEEVRAAGQAFLQDGIEDVVFVSMRFASGRVAHLHVSWLDPHKERRITLVGSKKMAVFDDMEPKEKIRIYDKGVGRTGGEAPEYQTVSELLQLRDGEIRIPALPAAEPLALECAAFLRSIETGTPPRSDGRDGIAVVRVLQAAQEALRADPIRFTDALR